MDNIKKKLKKQSFFLMLASYFVFIFLYQSSGIYTSKLNDVPSIYMRWEKNIPFISWLIIPYMSSGIFFIAIFFMCKTKERLYWLVKQINIITITSTIIFFLFPLQFAFEKPEVNNRVIGFLFKNLSELDTIFNLCPSLHISYAIIFTLIFYKEIRSKIKYIFYLWFFLLSISTIFIYQHHIIDVICSLFLVLTTLFIFPENSNDREKRSRKIGFIYLFFSLTLFTLGLLFLNWSILLLVPSLSLFLVGKTYIENNPSLIKKRGHIKFCNKLLYFPYLFCYNILWKYFRKYEGEPWKELVPNLFIGSKLNNEQSKKFGYDKKIIIIDLSVEAEENSVLTKNNEYYSFPFLDICELEETAFLTALELVIKKYNNLEHNEKIYIHCLMGYSRSVALAIAFLKKNYKMDNLEASLIVKKLIKNSVIPDYIIQSINKIKL